MNPEERLRMDALEAIAKQDPRYRELIQQMYSIEATYNSVLHDMDDAERNAICEFVAQCEDVSWYMLELACRYMRFP